MTFTYDLDNVTDIERVRFVMNDTDEALAMFSDEAIQFRLDENASASSPVGAAIVDLIRNRLAYLAGEPDMTADWLRIDWRRSTENWRTLLDEVRRKYGMGLTMTASVSHPWRPDLGMTEEPLYDD